ncbi:unnamed protein product [Effrenium voratum]|uniref:GYF domain-containing protein n=1 Tax=Effrenium voratum TaxID=2562239 RepID=A0AA36HV60_9DINO|nr:unnamed protein product [Effrenium voratum]
MPQERLSSLGETTLGPEWLQRGIRSPKSESDKLAETYRYARDQLLLLQSSMQLPAAPRQSNGRPVPTAELQPVPKYPVFGAMTKENLVSEGVLPASSLEDKAVAGTLRGRGNEGRGRVGKGQGRKGRGDEDPDLQIEAASPAQDFTSPALGPTSPAPLELPEAPGTPGEVEEGTGKNPMNSFLARVLKNKQNEAAAAAAAEPPPVLPPAVALEWATQPADTDGDASDTSARSVPEFPRSVPEFQAPLVSPVSRPPVPMERPPPPPGGGIEELREGLADGWLDRPERELRPGPLPATSPPRHPLGPLSPLLSAEPFPEPLLSPQRASVNLANALAREFTGPDPVVAPPSAPMSAMTAMSAPGNAPQALQPGRVTAPPPKQQAPMREEPLPMTKPAAVVRAEEEEIFQKERCWYYKDPSQRIQGPFTTSQMQHWQQVGYFKPELPIRFRESGNFYRLDLLYPEAPFSQLPAIPDRGPVVDPRAQLPSPPTPAMAPNPSMVPEMTLHFFSIDGQKLSMRVPDWSGSQLVYALHRQLPRKPGTALSVLFNDKQLEPKATLSAQGIQEDSELSLVFEAKTVCQACRVFGGLARDNSCWNSLEGLTKLHLGKNLDGSVDSLNLPSSLQVLSFGDQFNQSLGRFRAPSALQVLAFGHDFSQSLKGVELPETLRSLSFGPFFNQPLDVKLPSGLKNLALGGFNRSLQMELPDGLENLVFGTWFNQSLEGVRLPSQLQVLTFGAEFNRSLDKVSLPYNLEILRFGGNFNQKLPRCLPVALQSLALGYEYQQSFEKVSWSPNLKTLVLGGNYRKLISMDSLLNRLQGVFNFGLSHGCNDQHKHLPQTLESLSLGHDFNESLRQVKLPKGLVSLTLGAKFNQILDADWPSSLQSLTLGHCFNRSLQPCCRITRLQSLTLGENFNQSLQGVEFPAGLQHLSFGRDFDQDLSGVEFPPGLESLSFGAKFNRPLTLLPGYLDQL